MDNALTHNIRMFTKPFYYLRHGQTETNAHRLVAGSLDVDLTALGREQALAAAKALTREPITQIYSSPLKRARHTAEPIAAALNVPLAIIAEIAERNWGDLEGKP
ncbi:MAG TPA: histidine phosphatase family protein, partial [Burkholderiales bacterium]|nr:histidine phosphatase family protein [Burkholderiales bacterium]